LDPSEFNIGNFEKRLKRADPWKDFFKQRQSLDKATKALQKL
jgi:DNA primase